MTRVALGFVDGDGNVFAAEKNTESEPGQTAADDGDRFHGRTAPKKWEKRPAGRSVRRQLELEGQRAESSRSRKPALTLMTPSLRVISLQPIKLRRCANHFANWLR